MLSYLTEDGYHPCKGTVSKMVIRLRVSEQLLLPFGQASQANIHQFARRFGLKVRTKTIVKDNAKLLRVERVA